MNNIINFIKKNIYKIIFIILVFLSLFFLFLHKGQWLYLDHMVELKFLSGESFLSKNIALNNQSYYTSYDYNSFIRFFIYNIIDVIRFIFRENLLIPLFIIYFTLSFFFSKKCFLEISRNEKCSELVALLYTFNPISIYFLDMYDAMFFYFSFPALMYLLIRYKKTKNFIYINISFLFLLTIIAYPRTAVIYFIFYLVLIVFVFGKDFLQTIKDIKISEKVKIVFTGILVFMPILFFILFLFSENNYSKNQLDYPKYILNKDIAKQNFNLSLKENFIESFYVKEMINDFSSKYKDNLYIVSISILYFMSIFLYALSLYRKGYIVNLIHKKLLITSFSLFIISIFLNKAYLFTSYDVFKNITYKYLPFLATNTEWIMIWFLISFLIILYFCLFYTKSKIIKVFLISSTLVYIVISIVPLMDIKNNYKLKKIDISNIPKNYKNTFFKANDDIVLGGSNFYPRSENYFNWSPYPINISVNSNYIDLLRNDPRIVNAKQIDLDMVLQSLYSNKNYCKNICDKTCYIQYVCNYSSKSFKEDFFMNSKYYYYTEIKNLKNISVLNLKNLFVFKDIRNAKAGEFDCFPWEEDWVSKSKNWYVRFKSNPDLDIKDDNENLTHFTVKDSGSFDFSIYSPREVLNMNSSESFFDKKIDIYTRPLILDNDVYNLDNKKLKNLDDISKNQNIKVDIKTSLENRSKHYVKLSNLDTSKPFILQMNQTFGPSWKIKFVDERYFQEKNCIEEYKEYPITNNKICYYKSRSIELEDARLLIKKGIKDENHFEGNFIGNTWIINPEDIPNELKNKNEIYLVIIFEKQIYYEYAIIISISTLLVLSATAIIQWIKNKHFPLYKKSDKIIK